MCKASEVLKIALAEEGYLEKASNKSLDDKTANAGKKNFTKYARDLDKISGFYNGKKQGAAWCDVFVDWCFVQAFGADKAKSLLCQPGKSLGAGCKYSMNYYKSKGQFHTAPAAGDQIFFKSGSTITHTGLVYDVDKTYVYTVEGNTSSASGVVANGGCVRKKKYKLTNSAIAGYGRPAYTAEKKAETTETPTANNAIYTVVKGDTLAKIAKKYGTTVDAIAKLNGIANPNKIKVGQKLKISGTVPAVPEYQCIHNVVKGDTLWKLAKKYLGSGIKYTKIMKLNGKKKSSLSIGEKLKIPHK